MVPVILLLGTVFWTAVGFFGVRGRLAKGEPVPAGLDRLRRLSSDHPNAIKSTAIGGAVLLVLIAIGALNAIESFQGVPAYLALLGPLGAVTGASCALMLDRAT